MWKDYETKFTGILKSLDRHKQLIAEQAGLLHIQQYRSDSRALLDEIRKYEEDRSQNLANLKKMEEIETERRILKILEWFAAASSTKEDHAIFQAVRSQYPGIGHWILSDKKVIYSSFIYI